MRKTGTLIDFTIKRGNREFSMRFEGPRDLITLSRKMSMMEFLHKALPGLYLFKPKRSSELNCGRRNGESLSNSDSFRAADIKKPRESECQGALPLPPVSPKEDLLPIARSKFRPKFEQVLS
jgi:hypothetical protein